MLWRASKFWLLPAPRLARTRRRAGGGRGLAQCLTTRSFCKRFPATFGAENPRRLGPDVFFAARLITAIANE
jgi:hypothetical protein